MNQKQHKVLIIKVGYSETLDPEISNVTSYGDVLRSTVLLNLYRDNHVTWLVDEKAYPILKNNPHIDRVLIYNLSSVLQLQSEQFDTVINLEKVPGLCAMTDSINAWRRYGFRFDGKTGEAEAYDRSHGVLERCRNIDKKKERKAYWQEILFEMVGAEWKGEEYVLGYKPKGKVKYDIGFNHEVGTKWPLKPWPMEYWKELESLMGDRYSISWQKGLENMEEYFEWVNSCKLIVTNDSFGMHIAIALKRKLIALFGATNYRETYLYGLGASLYPENVVCDEIPCRLKKCIQFKDTCMALVKPDMVLREIDRLMRKRLTLESERETLKS
ncbi:MAG: glycosyltransferase family 9 protein [Candidatus Omnitrophica bacterium]|nr:glycosyltransferase family 9 protein [Candidatus Omnitrophota bacterium]